MKMKKYLMTGIAALALCAGFTSCSHDLDSYTPEQIKEMEAKKIVEKYNQAFEATFGKPKANHNWGFAAPTGTRTRAEGIDLENWDKGAYTNANMWAEDFIVPTQLTPGQKLRVQKYFQTHKNPGSAEEKTITDFFVQQVYDGYDDPMEGTDPATGKPYSPERYLAADGTTYINSGDHMDHLIVGGNHVNNFNNATYGTKGAPNTNVQSSNDEIYYEWGTKTPLDASSTEHSDQIQLMLNTTAYPWSYANSDASYVRDNRWTLVSAAVIDEWGRAAGIGEDVTDKWNRSFIGFDFDQLPDQNCYTGTTAYYGDANARNNDWVYTLDGDITAITNGDTKIIVDGKEIPYLITDQNEYCGDFVGVGGMDNLNDYNLEAAYVDGGDNDNTLYLNTLPNGAQSDLKALNMNFIAKMVRAGYLPVSGKNLRKWVRIGGCNDGYYTDWIVTFCEALPANEEIPTDLSIRVMAEDLSVTDPQHDFDFNDVVFDVIRVDDNTAKIILQAAGGTLPLRIGSNNGVGGFEVHAKFGVDTNVMVNTRWKGAARVPAVDCGTITIEDGFTVDNFYDTVRDLVRVEVEKTGSDGNKYWLLLEAPKNNNAPSKFGCPVGTDWVNERVFIDTVYNFTEWVTGADYTLKPRVEETEE